ncbi:hypothetical protein MNB_SV-12-1911 [hydrothermal vent metagenome]|uniref:Uncharacterized protein n=1 Tax=hydrothermal vent metagenome TaxID=652676 RepID=A0A1W1BYV0_9ZZZZ
MKIGLYIIVLFNVVLFADGGDWGEDRESINKNNAFEEVKIKNRSKKEYDDKVYKYITGNYKVENNDIELATIHLDDNIRNNDIEVNVISKDLKVEGDSYRDSIDIKRNQYKNFVQNDESSVDIVEENNQFSELGNVQSSDSRYNKVPNEDVSELETIDLRGNHKIKEVNVLIEDVNVRVD